MLTTEFLTAVFGEAEGYLFISSKTEPQQEEVDIHKAFKYPDQFAQIETYVSMREGQDLYFSPMLYEVPRRKASAVAHTPVAYADTDSFDIDKFLIAPSINIATSEGRHASFWLLDDAYTPAQVSTLSRTIALTHSWKDEHGKQGGVDPGGWDLSQLLRLPNSTNLKCEVEKFKSEYTEPFKTHVDIATGTVYSLEEMIEAYSPDNIPERPHRTVATAMPTDLPAPKDVLARITASSKLSELYSNEPRQGQDWSDTLYLFVSEMFRAGFTPEETLVGAWYAACNKYRRDNRPMSDLWEYDVLSALNDPKNRPNPSVDREAVDEELKDEGAIASALEIILLSEAERGTLTRTFIDEYVAWGVSRTDAPEPYHVASAFTILSCVLGEYGVGFPQYGQLRLGMFFIIMGETTDTRKSTTRNLMKKFLNFLDIRGGEDEGYILNGDTTPETLLDDLSERGHRSSLYDRDEAQQLINDIKNKGYLRGFFETLNELYDGKAHGRSRQAKKTKDTEVNFVQYLMGIRTQIQDNLEVSDFASGYLPRNIFVRGESPPRTKETDFLKQGNPNQGKHDPLFIELTTKMFDVRTYWKTQVADRAEPMPIVFEDDAWQRWNDFKWDLKQYVGHHPRAEILRPSVERLSTGVLKAAVMFAMMNKRSVGNMTDVLNAIYYGAQWVEDLIIVAEGVSASAIQRDVEKFVSLLESNKGLMTYAAVSRWASKEGKTKRDIAELIERMEDSDIIRTVEDRKDKKSIELLT